MLATALLLGACDRGRAADEQAAAVSALEERGLEVVKRFDAPGGLTGYTARAGGREVVLYATADGQHVLLGNLLDSQGRNLTQGHLQQHMPEPDRSGDWAKLENSHYVAVGAEDPERVVYAFTDPNCPYCQGLWLALEPYLDDGVQVRHVMVGILRESSQPKAAAVLGADDPAGALQRHADHFEAGGIDAPADPAAGPMKQVEANNQLMRELGLRGTPALYYRTSEGKVGRAEGLPSDQRLAEILDRPVQRSEAAFLDRLRSGR
jgi:thiol:disulfide interchange protein DsbG